MARLAALRGRIEPAEQLWEFGQAIVSEHPELKDPNQCLLQSQRFSIDVERASGDLSTFDAQERVQGLIDKGCPFTAQALHYATQAVKRQQSAQALATLQRAKASCDSHDCRAYSRMQQIEALIAVAQGEPATLKRETQSWLKRLKYGVMLSTELQIVWALAERLHTAGNMADAAALYQALDDTIEIRRNLASGSTSDDLARYDELKRMRVRINVELGNKVTPPETESLRGQNLLRHLRSQRWLKELSGEDDAEAKAERDRQLANLKSYRQQLEQSPRLARLILPDAEDLEEIARNTYLNKLAAKKLKVTGDFFREPSALNNYRQSETFSPVISLDDDEAYLSWLRVPGGYVGTLLALTPRDLVGNRVMSLNTRHGLRQLFVPFTAQDESMLKLYRDLLQSGTSIGRGSKITLSIETDKAGLMLNGLPIWQQGDGGFVTGKTAPSGASRIKTFGDLSDALFERFLAPFAEQYQDARRLIISPDGALSYLPFETLTRRGVPVLETVDIGYVQSLAVYGELKKRGAAKKRQSEPSLLTVADPLYAPSTPAPAAGRPEATPARGLEALSWPSLPGTRKESAALARLFGDHLQLLGAKASKIGLADLQNRNKLKGFRILHFATHGYVDDERSALVLSAGPTPMSGYLLDGDIVGWDLDSDLVLLSACNTGIGRQQKGEGVVGLPYAFFMAGNINTLMSLWPVDDAGTAALIPAFMQRIERGEDHVAALNDTKRAFARGEYGEALRNPRVWSAFVLYGVPLAR